MIPEQRLSTQVISGNYLYPDDQEITDTQDWEMGGVALLDTSQGLEYQAWVSSASGASILLRALNTGTISSIYTKPGILQHSFSFDQNMRWQLVYTLDDGTVEHVWYDSAAASYVTTMYDNGEQSPRLFLDDKRTSQRSSSDVLLTYIRNGALYFRAQRDRYLIEYTLLEGFSPEVLILNTGMNNKLRIQWTTTQELIPPPPVPPPPPPVPPPTFTILNSSLGNSYVGESFALTLRTKNGIDPITWSKDQGLIPPGLILNSSGLISGTPTTVGSYTFSVSAVDSNGDRAMRTIMAEVFSTSDMHFEGVAYPYAPASFQSTNSTKYSEKYFGFVKLVGGKPPYTGQLVGGDAPTPNKIYSGNLDGQMGVWLMVPKDTLLAASNNFTESHSYNFTLKAIDSEGAEATTNQMFTIPRGPYVSDYSSNITQIGQNYEISIPYGNFLEAEVEMAGGVGNYTFQRNNVQSGPLLAISKIGPKRVKVSGSTTFSGPPDPWNYTYACWVDAIDSRGGPGGNALFPIRLFIKFTPP